MLTLSPETLLLVYFYLYTLAQTTTFGKKVWMWYQNIGNFYFAANINSPAEVGYSMIVAKATAKLMKECINGSE